LRRDADYLVPPKTMLNSSRYTELLERQKESGLSVRGFCSNEGIAPSTFYYWQKKLRKRSDGHGFIPLVVNTRGLAACLSPGQPNGTGMDSGHLEISYPNGTTLRIRQNLDLTGLRSLVTLLD
jgi:hypothetical protein